MPRPRTSRALKDAVSKAFGNLTKKGLSQAAIARQLKVKRQAVHQWVKGKTLPSQQVLAKAMRLWGFKILVDGYEFDQESFGLTADKASVKPIQLTLDDLFARPAEVEIPGGKLILRVAGKELKTVEISVKLNLSA